MLVVGEEILDGLSELMDPMLVFCTRSYVVVEQQMTICRHLRAGVGPSCLHVHLGLSFVVEFTMVVAFWLSLCL